MRVYAKKKYKAQEGQREIVLDEDPAMMTLDLPTVRSSPSPQPTLPPTEILPTDAPYLELFYNRTDIKMSLLQDILSLAQLPPPSFSTAAGMMALVDSLPGPWFNETLIPIDGSQVQYILRHRDLLEIIQLLIRRLNGLFLDPLKTYPGEFVNGSRFKGLSQKLLEHDPSAILMPIAFNSGRLAFFGFLCFCI
jgi:hypothetical protein